MKAYQGQWLGSNEWRKPSRCLSAFQAASSHSSPAGGYVTWQSAKEGRQTYVQPDTVADATFTFTFYDATYIPTFYEVLPVDGSILLPSSPPLSPFPSPSSPLSSSPVSPLSEPSPGMFLSWVASRVYWWGKSCSWWGGHSRPQHRRSTQLDKSQQNR